MTTLTKYCNSFLVAFISCGFFALNAQEADKLNIIENKVSPAQEWTQDKLDVKAAVERLLAAAGNYDAKTLTELTSEKANMGILKMKDGKWVAETIMVSEYLDSFNNRE